MSHLKYLFVFSISPSRKTCFYFSLKTGCITSTFIAVCILTIGLITELILSNSNKYYILIKHFLFSILNFVSFVYMVKSKYEFEYTKAYLGYLSFVITFGLHILIFMINVLFNLQFSSIWQFKLHSTTFTTVDNLLYFILPNVSYLFYEFVTSWICYSYAKNLSEGNDALVDGQNFDRYFEDLGSENVSRESRELKNRNNMSVNDSMN